eukprot:jgi/Mesvir1/28342/Mv24028-RA.1
MEDDADEVAARPIAPIRQGTSHPLHVRKLIAMAVHTRKERKEKLYQIAERFGVDRKTARVYHRLWVDDGKPDYADEGDPTVRVAADGPADDRRGHGEVHERAQTHARRAEVRHGGEVAPGRGQDRGDPDGRADVHGVRH